MVKNRDFKIEDSDKIREFLGQVFICTVWYDAVNKLAKFEPVGTHPNYRRMGLGRCVIEEGLRRVKKLGANIAYVDAGGENRENFYKSAGFIPQNINRSWFKIIKK